MPTNAAILETSRYWPSTAASRAEWSTASAYDLEEAEQLVADASRLVAAVQDHFGRLGLAGTDLTPVW